MRLMDTIGKFSKHIDQLSGTSGKLFTSVPATVQISGKQLLCLSLVNLRGPLPDKIGLYTIACLQATIAIAARWLFE